MKLATLTLAAAALCAASLQAQYTLTILHFNDTESQLLHAGAPSADMSKIPTASAGDLQNYGGAARFVTLLETLRSQATTDGVITISAGDNYLPGIELDASNPTKNAANTAGDNYDALLFAAAGVDVSAIGNHEFDAGPDYFQSWITKTEAGNTAIPGVEVPFVSANLNFSAYPALDAQVTPSVIIEKGGEQIGIIGGTTPLLPGISSVGDVGMVDADSDGDSDLDDLAQLIQAEVDTMMFNGVTKIIVVTHLQNIRNEQQLVTKLRGVDVVIGGGGNELLSNDGNPIIPGTTPLAGYPLLNDANGQPVLDLDGKNIPVIVANGDMRFVGRAVVTFDVDGNVTAFEGNDLLVSAFGDNAVAPDAIVQSAIVDPVYDYVVALNTTEVATTDVALDGRRSSVRNMETNLGNLVADAMLYAGQSQAAQYAAGYDAPVVSLQNGGGIRNDSVLPAGPLTLGTLNSVLPFTNFVSIVPNIPPAQLKEIAEHVVAKAGQSGGQFGQIAGMHIVYDIRGTAQVTASNGESVTTPGTRVVSLTLADGTPIVIDGQVVPTAPEVTMSTINFLAAGGDNYPFYGLMQIDTPMLYQDALRIYVEEGLDSQITAADYPEGGEGRIVRLQNLVLQGESFDNSWSWSPWMGYYFVDFYPYVWVANAGHYVYISEASTQEDVWAYSYETGANSWMYLSPDYHPWVWYADGRGSDAGWVNLMPTE